MCLSSLFPYYYKKTLTSIKLNSLNFPNIFPDRASRFEAFTIAPAQFNDFFVLNAFAYLNFSFGRL